jgi:DNA-binding GntR family transcriptional regulator
LAQGALPQLRIKRTSTAEQVAQALRTAILRGELKPATPLREADVAGSLGVSRNTVREAIRLLVNQGLATHHMHRGGAVVQLDTQDVADIYRVRRVLELRAVMRADADPERLAGLAAALAEWEEAVQSEDPELLVEKDILFHREIVALLGSRRLNDFFSNLQSEVHLCLAIISTADAEYLHAEDVVAEHREIYELLARGKNGEAREALRRHLDSNEARLKQIIGERARAGGD